MKADVNSKVLRKRIFVRKKGAVKLPFCITSLVFHGSLYDPDQSILQAS